MFTTRFAALALAVSLVGAAQAGTHLLQFDDGSTDQLVGNAYLVSDGVRFVGGQFFNSGNAFGNPSKPGVLFSESSDAITMNSLATLTGSVGFSYAAAYGASVSVYSGLNGTGTLLGTLSLAAAANPSNPYGTFTQKDLTFSGGGHSLVFTGDARFTLYDDVSFTTAAPGPMAALPFLLGLRRRRRPRA